ncbi:trypsin-like serine protease [bacterium]|nr:trypsin-like serine protease [bacterium]
MSDADERFATNHRIAKTARQGRSLLIVFFLILHFSGASQALEIVDIRPTVVRGTFVSSDAATQLAATSNYDPVGMLSINGNTASGTLIRSDWVLTAAHVISNSAGHFDLASATFNVGGQPMVASYAEVHPNWNGDLGSGFDLALVKLAAPSASITPASFRDAPAQLTGQSITFLGYGQGGTGDSGTIPDSAGVKRAGTNMLDTDGSILGMSPYIYMSDFDSGSSSDNSLGTSTPTEFESVLAPGDSGGGVFMTVGGSTILVGVNSFVASFAGQANSTYGNIAGFVSIQPHIAWIDSIAHAPEPASIVLGLIAGFVIWRAIECKSASTRKSAGKGQTGG